MEKGIQAINTDKGFVSLAFPPEAPSPFGVQQANFNPEKSIFSSTKFRKKEALPLFTEDTSQWSIKKTSKKD